MFRWCDGMEKQKFYAYSARKVMPVSWSDGIDHIVEGEESSRCRSFSLRNLVRSFLISQNEKYDKERFCIHGEQKKTDGAAILQVVEGQDVS